MKQSLRFQQNGYLDCVFKFGFSHALKTAVFFCVLLGAAQLAQAQCTIAISKVTVSGCYLVGNQSKATVSVEVA